MTQIAAGYYLLSSYSYLTIIELVRTFGEIVCVILETWIPCYYGEKIRTAHEELAKAIYEVNWYEQDIKFRGYFLIFLHRAQKDEYLLAGKMIPVTLQSFLTVNTYY